MFNLEQSIAAWRRQILAAGIKSPVPLEELEIHLREEIEQQMLSGLNAEKAFDAAAKKIGRVDVLKAEFAKMNGTERSAKWKRRIAAAISMGVVVPLGSYALFHHEMSPGWRMLGFSDLTLIVLAVFGCRRINRSFPVVPDKRVRTVIGIAFGLLSMSSMVVFMNFILPNFELTEGQLTVVVLWSLTLMAALGAVWSGLEEAARKQITTID